MYAKNLDNLEEINTFLETYTPPRLTQEETKNLNRLITRKEIESVIKTPKKQKSSTRQIHGKFYQVFKEHHFQTIPKN